MKQQQRLILFVIVCCVLVLGGGGVYWFFIRDDNSENSGIESSSNGVESSSSSIESSSIVIESTPSSIESSSIESLPDSIQFQISQVETRTTQQKIYILKSEFVNDFDFDDLVNYKFKNENRMETTVSSRVISEDSTMVAYIVGNANNITLGNTYTFTRS